MPTNYSQKIAQQMNLRPQQVAATIELLDAGNTLPFVARYRKEVTGSLDEDQIRKLLDSVTKMRALDERRDTILKTIDEQGKLTPDLRQQIEQASTTTALEDLYQPYKPKRRTRATAAREKGLQGLADLIMSQKQGNQRIEELAKNYLNADVASVEEALNGARDIVAETISDDPEVRGEVREKALKWGLSQSAKVPDAEDPKGTYQLYYEFEYRIDRVKPYQILALNRGESEKVLRVRVNVADRDWLQAIQQKFRPNHRSPLAEQIEMAATDAAKRLLLPAIERDVRAILTEQAEDHAIQVFADNLRGLLLQPPLAGQTVMGIDPAYRTGCKVAVVDATGKVLDTITIYPHQPQNRQQEALDTLAQLITRHKVTLIAIGNGTASRETEQLVAELTRRMQDIHYLMVNEAGASVYSASPLAREELPELDVTLRGAVSIARRALDPLAELVKIDPKSIGVGLYQHDVNQKQLEAALDNVVEITVNHVGVDLNTASAALLTHVAGIGPKLADAIVAYRNANGPFKSLSELKKVPGLGPKAFEQAAGFLRIRDGSEPLDNTAIHPESYKIAKAILKQMKLKDRATLAEREAAINDLRLRQSLEDMAKDFNTGVPTLKDILEQLARPGRDPREDLPAPILRSDVLSMEDLQTGMKLNGTVRNVVDFGAFIDIGVKQDGLLHRSQIPRDAQVGVGEVLEVEILNVDIERGRIGLGWV
ncbi:MAG: RNA-binding transcriptional accessory protein [Anaerolineaceae bacterium]|nr:RNA-binding transcriptional accessory protein [Anaerolineaceae bacterium]